MQRIWVPATFWDDHYDRSPCDGPSEAGLAKEVRRAANRVLIEGSHDQIECLRADAQFHCDPSGPDECPNYIKRSAAATLRALGKVQASP